MSIITPPKKRHLFCLSFAFLAAILVLSNIFWNNELYTTTTSTISVDEALRIEKKIQELEENILKQDERLKKQENKSSLLGDKLIPLQAHKSLSALDSEEVSFVSSAKKCAQPATGIVQKSQSGEDAFLMTWFGGLCGGTYIELGALDGVMFSNSYVFNKSLQWKGVLIELIKRNYDALVINRPNEIATMHAGVCDKPQKLHYVTTDRPAINGIYEFASPSFRKKWWGNDISLDDPKVQEIDCDTLDGLLLKNEQAKNITFFDFFSLDVEGAELAVLESTNFDRVGFGIILAEASPHNMRKNLAIKSYMESKGYIFMNEKNKSYWFMNSKFHQIYKDLIY